MWHEVCWRVAYIENMNCFVGVYVKLYFTAGCSHAVNLQNIEIYDLTKTKTKTKKSQMSLLVFSSATFTVLLVSTDSRTVCKTRKRFVLIVKTCRQPPTYSCHYSTLKRSLTYFCHIQILFFPYPAEFVCKINIYILTCKEKIHFDNFSIFFYTMAFLRNVL